MSIDNARTYPTFPIPAVGAIVLHRNHLLLIRRGKAPSKGRWTLPGGAIELGESPEEALMREVWEECGLAVTPQKLVMIFNRVLRDTDERIQYHYIILDYFAECQQKEGEGNPPLHAGSDVLDARWVPLQGLAEFNITKGLQYLLDQTVFSQCSEFARYTA